MYRVVFAGVRVPFERMAATAVVAAILVPAAASAQNSSNSSGVALPEIQVLSTTPLTPPRRPVRRAAATAPAGTPAANAAQPQSPPPPEPGVVDADKIPSNVQTLTAADFSHATAPNLLGRFGPRPSLACR